MCDHVLINVNGGTIFGRAGAKGPISVPSSCDTIGFKIYQFNAAKRLTKFNLNNLDHTT